MTHKYDIGDILLHRSYPLDDGYYLIEDIKTINVLNKKTHEVYSLRHLLVNNVCDHSTSTIDELSTIEKVA